MTGQSDIPLPGVRNQFAPLVERLLASDEPSVVLRTRLDVLGEATDTRAVRDALEAVRHSGRVQALLSGMDTRSPYAKWFGLHWGLVDLADLGYPAGDRALETLAERELEWLVNLPGRGASRPVAGRHRQHASFEGNALYSVLTLGLAQPRDSRVQEAVRRLLEWQWPDGGWNCDRHPSAHVSSIFETATPLRGLTAYARLTGDAAVRDAAERAAEVLLARRLFRHRSTGEIIRRSFLELHHPCYWHYDVLFGLRLLWEAGRLEDPRCDEAVTYLRSRELATGGWSADATYWRMGAGATSDRSLVRWGPVGKTRLNEFVTVGALTVLTATS